MGISEEVDGCSTARGVNESGRRFEAYIFYECFASLHVWCVVMLRAFMNILHGKLEYTMI